VAGTAHAEHYPDVSLHRVAAVRVLGPQQHQHFYWLPVVFLPAVRFSRDQPDPDSSHVAAAHKTAPAGRTAAEQHVCLAASQTDLALAPKGTLLVHVDAAAGHLHPSSLLLVIVHGQCGLRRTYHLYSVVPVADRLRECALEDCRRQGHPLRETVHAA